MHAEGNGIVLACATLLSICRAKVDLFVILRVPSQLDNAQECFKTSLISRLRLVATETIFLYNLQSAFRMTSFPGSFVF